MGLKQCPNCSNTKIGGVFGNMAFKCSKCGQISCGKCVKRAMSTRCPHCDQKLESKDRID